MKHTFRTFFLFFIYLLLAITVVYLQACSNNSTTQQPSQSKLIDAQWIHSTQEAKLQDPYRKYLWHIQSAQDNTLASLYTIHPDASANIVDAWEWTKGEGVIVAVIDNGFDVTHEDLKENIVLTYNITDKSSDVATQEEYAHGTAIAGIIGASSNGVGGIGVAPKVKLVFIKDHTLSTDADIIDAFGYAQKSGARVVNCSWGSNSVSQSVANKIKELYREGIVVVFAAGNEGMTLDRYGIDDESELAWVLGVGASSEYNTRTSYSNYGKSIDVLAPAGEYVGIVTTDEYGSRRINDQRGILGSGYTFFSGTSASAPVVSGVVALMLSVNPNLTPDHVREIIITTAQKIGGVEYIVGWNRKYAYGKIDAYAAVMAAKNYE